MFITGWILITPARRSYPETLNQLRHSHTNPRVLQHFGYPVSKHWAFGEL